jgi:hypothetical protein
LARSGITISRESSRADDGGWSAKRSLNNERPRLRLPGPFYLI